MLSEAELERCKSFFYKQQVTQRQRIYSISQVFDIYVHFGGDLLVKQGHASIYRIMLANVIHFF